MQDHEGEPRDHSQGNTPVQEKPSVEWSIRGALPSDIPFIYHSWIQSMHHDSRLGKSCLTEVFLQGQTQVIDAILSEPDTDIHVACDLTEHDVIFGYMVFQKPRTLHYVFVKKDFRRFGIADYFATWMMPQEDVEYTHRTESTKSFIIKNYPQMTYNPFLLYKGDL